MKDKIKMGAKFEVTDVRQLPPQLRADPIAREMVAATKDIAQANIVIDNAKRALDEAAQRVADAEKLLATAEARQAKAREDVEERERLEIEQAELRDAGVEENDE